MKKSTSPTSSKDKMIAVFSGLILVAILVSWFFLSLYREKNALIDKIGRMEQDLSEKDKSIGILHKQIYNLEHGGETDKWFEDNGLLRTGQDERLLAIADELGLKHIRRTNLKYGDQPIHIRGTYNNSGYGSKEGGHPIIIQRGLSSDQEKTTLAHEYLHYIYLNSSHAIKDTRLSDGVLNMYANNQFFKYRMVPYAEKGQMAITELLSVACTEIPYRNMDRYVLDWCNKWIDRSKIKMQY